MDPALIALLAVVALAFTIEGALGFGSTVVAVTLGAFLLPLDALLPAFIPLNLVVSVVLVVRGRDHVSFALLKRALPLLILGLPVGMLAARVVDGHALVRVYGALVAVLAIAQLALGRRRAQLPSAASTSTSAFVQRALLGAAGVVHGAFGTGGPLVVFALGRSLDDNKSAMRATLSAIWLVLNVLLIVSFAMDGKLTSTSAKSSALLAIGLVIGLVIGDLAHRRAKSSTFRTATWAMLAIAGVMLAMR